MADWQAVVLMGGRGTRLGLTDRPKCMAEVNGKPFFDWQLKLLRRWGFRRFLFLVGYMGNNVRQYYGDGEKFNAEIVYSFDGIEPLGTGGALKKAAPMLDDDFLLMYGDSFMDIDYRELVYRYITDKAKNLLGTMAIFCNDNALDKSNVTLQENDFIVYDKQNPTTAAKYIDYGVSVLSKNVITNARDAFFDIADLLSDISKQNKLAGHIVERRFYEIGSPAALDEFRRYAHERFDMCKKAAFFDRDGVINEIVFNEETEQLDSPFDVKDFRYKNGVVDTLAYLQNKGYLLFVVTNQPAAAKGKVSLDKLYRLNRRLTNDLRKKGVNIEFVNMCPHHPTGGNRTKEKFLVGECDCRKPKPGLLEELLTVYAVDRDNSFMIGDSHSDIIAAKKAGIRAILLGDMKCDVCQRLRDFPPDKIIGEISELKKYVGE